MKNYTQIINESFTKKYLRETEDIQNKDQEDVIMLPGELKTFEEVNSAYKKSRKNKPGDTEDIFGSQEEMDKAIELKQIEYKGGKTIIKISSEFDLGKVIDDVGSQTVQNIIGY